MSRRPPNGSSEEDYYSSSSEAYKGHPKGVQSSANGGNPYDQNQFKQPAQTFGSCQTMPGLQGQSNHAAQPVYSHTGGPQGQPGPGTGQGGYFTGHSSYDQAPAGNPPPYGAAPTGSPPAYGEQSQAPPYGHAEAPAYGQAAPYGQQPAQSQQPGSSMYNPPQGASVPAPANPYLNSQAPQAQPQQPPQGLFASSLNNYKTSQPTSGGQPVKAYLAGQRADRPVATGDVDVGGAWDDDDDESVMSLPGGGCKKLMYEWVMDKVPEDHIIPDYNPVRWMVEPMPGKLFYILCCPCNSCIGATAGACTSIPHFLMFPFVACYRSPSFLRALCTTGYWRNMLRCTCCVTYPCNCEAAHLLLGYITCTTAISEGCMAGCCDGPGKGAAVGMAIGNLATKFVSNLASGPVPTERWRIKEDEGPRSEMWYCLMCGLAPVIGACMPTMCLSYCGLAGFRCTDVFSCAREMFTEMGRGCLNPNGNAFKAWKCCCVPILSCCTVCYSFCDGGMFGCWRGCWTSVKDYHHQRSTDSYTDCDNCVPHYGKVCKDHVDYCGERKRIPVEDDSFWLFSYLEKHMASDWVFALFGWYLLCRCTEFCCCDGSEVSALAELCQADECCPDCCDVIEHCCNCEFGEAFSDACPCMDGICDGGGGCDIPTFDLGGGGCC